MKKQEVRIKTTRKKEKEKKKGGCEERVRYGACHGTRECML